MQVTDCPDPTTCPGEPHEWTPEPRVIHKPRRCLRGARVARWRELSTTCDCGHTAAQHDDVGCMYGWDEIPLPDDACDCERARA